MKNTRQSSSAHFPDDPDPDDPLIGARLRYGLAYVEQRIGQALADAGHADVQVAHFKVLRFPPPDNERPIDLANRAGMTKQAMHYLLVQLEDMGYVERVADEASPARLISLTAKGWKVAQIQRRTVREVEAEWERKIGKARFAAFYGVLKELTDTT